MCCVAVVEVKVRLRKWKVEWSSQIQKYLTVRIKVFETRLLENERRENGMDLANHIMRPLLLLP